jgi:hypothetical protein
LHDLPQGFDLAFVRGFLAFGLLEDFQNLIHLVERLAELGSDDHHFLDGFAHGIRMRGLQGMPRPRH